MEGQNEQVQEQTQEQDQGKEQQEQKKATGAVSFYKEEVSKYRQQLEELANEKQTLAQQLEQERQTKLEEKQNFKELWELEKQKREQAESKASEITTSYLTDLKDKAIEREAAQLGLRKEALEDLGLLDKSMIEVETTSTGRMNILGAKEFVESLKEKRPHWFGDQRPANINTGKPELNTREMSYEQILELQKKDPAKYKEIMEKKLSLA